MLPLINIYPKLIILHLLQCYSAWEQEGRVEQTWGGEVEEYGVKERELGNDTVLQCMGAGGRCVEQTWGGEMEEYGVKERELGNDTVLQCMGAEEQEV